MNANTRNILITIGVGLVIGFAICYFAIVFPAGKRAAADVAAANKLAEQYRTEVVGNTKTISDLSTTIEGQKSDIARLSSENATVRSNNSRLDAANKRLETDKGQLTSQLGYFSDYYNKSQQQDREFGVAVDAAQSSVSSAIADLRTLQGH